MEIKPIINLNELLEWELTEEILLALKNVPEYSVPSTPIYLLNSDEQKTYKTIVCHDMQGGYLQDRFCNGTSDSIAYSFFHWSGIDTFIYFSHKFITIPPLGWTTAAHKNGVKILGTLITEWDEGQLLCKELFSTPKVVETAAMQLRDITVAHKLDGWLINIENKISELHIDNVLLFLRHLTKLLHEISVQCEVIWYDSVTNSGKLNWQNELNTKNKCFFDSCDGIFLNYTWSEDHLLRSKLTAGQRYEEVYVGVDIFGRNCYGGGGFNTSKAMSVIRSHGLSCAIFAPGWTYELFGAENHFSFDCKLWTTLRPYLLYHGPLNLPIHTAFSQAFGNCTFEEGMVVCDKSWYNLQRQDIQPIWEEMQTAGVMCAVQRNVVYRGGTGVAVWFSDLCNVICLYITTEDYYKCYIHI